MPLWQQSMWTYCKFLFLVRQTDLVVAAAGSGKVVNLKKGQFMSPEKYEHAALKVTRFWKRAGHDYRSTMFSIGYDRGFRGFLPCGSMHSR
jgi:3-deoxy-D-manno-octulosonic acid (KDO) 8-phosphate synthase